MQNTQFNSINLTQMENVATQVIRLLKTPMTISLEGDLGAGKTTLVQLILKQLGYSGRVKSPTYNIIEEYQLDDKKIYHLDLYRITSPEELEYLAIDDIFASNSIRFIEWYENAQNTLEKPNIIIKINHNKDTRNIIIIR